MFHLHYEGRIIYVLLHNMVASIIGGLKLGPAYVFFFCGAYQYEFGWNAAYMGKWEALLSSIMLIHMNSSLFFCAA